MVEHVVDVVHRLPLFVSRFHGPLLLVPACTDSMFIASSHQGGQYVHALTNRVLPCLRLSYCQVLARFYNDITRLSDYKREAYFSLRHAKEHPTLQVNFNHPDDERATSRGLERIRTQERQMLRIFMLGKQAHGILQLACSETLVTMNAYMLVRRTLKISDATPSTLEHQQKRVGGDSVTM